MEAGYHPPVEFSQRDEEFHRGFAEEYDFNEHMVVYKDQLYFTLIGGGMKGCFIELEDSTRILVEDITD